MPAARIIAFMSLQSEVVNAPQLAQRKLMSKYNSKPIRLARSLYFGRQKMSYVFDYTWVNAYILWVKHLSFSSEIFEYAN